jgi:hypothetical protein
MSDSIARIGRCSGAHSRAVRSAARVRFLPIATDSLGYVAAVKVRQRPVILDGRPIEGERAKAAPSTSWPRRTGSGGWSALRTQ